MILTIKTMVILLLSLTASASFAAPAGSPKNVILLIGDGMGPQAAGLLLNYARYAPGSEYGGSPSALEKAMGAGRLAAVLPRTWDWLTGDSAALSTSLASGEEARPGVIGADKDGRPVENVTRRARGSGRAVGLVSDVRITHATPAGFAARSRDRDLEEDIAVSLLEAGPEVMLSGGLDYFIPREGAGGIPTRFNSKGKRKDGRDLLAEARAAGYATVFDRRGLAAARGPKVLGLFENSRMTDAITALSYEKESSRVVPMLGEMTAKALELLDSGGKGFFLMVEAGQIDTAGHQNDPGRLLHEMIVFDRTLDLIMKWMEGRDDTLLLVTADHETGGFSLNYSAMEAPPEPVRLEGEVFGGRAYTEKYNYAAPSVLDRLRSQKRSFENLLRDFVRLPEKERVPARLAAMVSDAGPAVISEAEAAEALKEWDGPYRKFYTGKEEALCGALSRQVSPKLNISWATGTHSATPFFLVALGHESSGVFSGVMSASEVGARLLGLF